MIAMPPTAITVAELPVEPDVLQAFALEQNRLACVLWEQLEALQHQIAQANRARGSNLSGGQRQRLAIARALLGNPRILIFDEATSALDFETEHVIRNNMKAICAGRTVIIIAHRLSAVRDADRIIAMDRGHIVEQGNHETLLGRSGYYARLVSLQDG